MYVRKSTNVVNVNLAWGGIKNGRRLFYFTFNFPKMKTNIVNGLNIENLKSVTTSKKNCNTPSHNNVKIQ